MHIGFDAKRFFHNSTGLGNYSRNLIFGLTRYCPEHVYHLYDGRVGDKFCTKSPAGQVFVHEPCPPLRRVPALWRLAGIPRTARSDRLDIYHGLSHELPVIRFSPPTRTVVTMHDLLFVTHPHLYPRLDRTLYTLKYRASCRRADMVIAVSRATAEEVVERFGIPHSRVRVAYQSCDPAFEHRLDDAALNQLRHRYDLPDEFILFVGSLIARKGVQTLLRAVAAMPAADRRPLLIGGTGAMRQALEVEAARLGLGALVRFPGRIPQEDLPGLYQAATVFAYPSEAEGFGIPILEGLVSGVPVITSKGSCFSEPGGDAALYTTPGDSEELSAALSRVLDDASLRAHMIACGHRHARQFSLRQTTSRLMDLYTLARSQ